MTSAQLHGQPWRNQTSLAITSSAFIGPDHFPTTRGDAMLMRAPAQETSTSKESWATGTELRQREKGTGDLAAWNPDSGGACETTATLRADATGSTDRQEVITVPGNDTTVVTATKNGHDSASVSIPASTFEKDTGGGTGYAQVLVKDLAITN